jgi:benzoate/toluate 1,2-dioxygenase reductase subunit
LPEQEKSPGQILSTELVARRWLTGRTFEIELKRPASFNFIAGQRIRFLHEGIERDYSLISAPVASSLFLCVRHVKDGRFSPVLARAKIGTRFSISGPHGYFIFQPSRESAVFVATGTGIAPFVSMARSGLTGFTLLHGVRKAVDVYYEDLFRSVAGCYVPCLSGTPNGTAVPSGAFSGRVTDYLERRFSSGSYDFYLCGRLEMVRDVTLIADERYTGSLIHTEIFY